VWLPRRVLSPPTGASVPVAPTVEASAPPTPPADSASSNESPDSGTESSPEPEDEHGNALLPNASKEVITAANQESNVDLQGLGEAVAGLSKPSGTSTALVVEDDDKSSKLVRLLLEAEGFQVIAAVSGEEALDLARTVPISLITLDVQLPGMDGWKFLLKLHDSPELASIPVVVIADLADMSMALNRGASAVLEKPLRRADLQHSLTLLELRPDQARPPCILVVDDDLAAIDQVHSYLAQPAYRVRSASTGEEAITNALTLKPDLILINLMMEELGGFKIVRALQEHATTRHIPVLVMSSGQLTNEEQDTIDSDPGQPVVAMNKPDINREALLAEINRAFD
jgi:CheY-like chemotaxis protein